MRPQLLYLILFVAFLISGYGQGLRAAPPFSGTIFIDGDIVTSTDPSAFESISYTGLGIRTVFDRRVNAWTTRQMQLFSAGFEDGLSSEIQVNPEFGGVDAAQIEAVKYANVLGRLPTALRADMSSVTIHQGDQPFGGGNDNVLIHTGYAATYEASGILEEALVHEASHTSLDADHADASGWLAAQAADGEFISTYAKDFPTREDIAESFLPWLAVRYRRARLDPTVADQIEQTIPNRIAYFNSLSLDLYPVVPEPSTPAIVAVVYLMTLRRQRSIARPVVRCPGAPTHSMGVRSRMAGSSG